MYALIGAASIFILVERGGSWQRLFVFTAPLDNFFRTGDAGTVGSDDFWRGWGNQPRPSVSKSTAVLLALMMLVAVATISGPMLVINPQIPLQGWDPVFHANGIAVVEQTQSASYFGSLTALYGLDTTPTNYAVAWHAIASLVATAQNVIVSMNAFIVVISVLWITGVWGLIRSLGLDNRYVLAGLATIAAMLVFPTYLTSTYPPIPNAFAVALLPGFLALVAITVREGVRDQSVKVFGIRVLALLLLAVGSLFVHPSMITSLALLLVVPFTGLLVKFFMRAPRRHKLVALVFSIALILATVLTLILVPSFQERLRAQLTYDTTPGVLDSALLKTVTAWPMLGAEMGRNNATALLLLQAGLFVLLVFGVGTLIVKKSRRWLILVWLVTAVLTFTTMARQGPFVAIAGLWYMSPHRAMSLQQIPMAVLISIGLVTFIQLARKLIVSARARRYFTAGFLIIVQLVVAGLSLGPRSYMIKDAWGYRRPAFAMVSEDETAMLYRLRDQLPTDAIVLGDPSTGAGFVKAITGRDVVFAQLYVRESNEREWYLARHLSDINTDPQVCQFVNELGITHYYADSNYFNLGASMRERMPGLYHVPVYDGFELVDSGGTADVYEITACR
ncbi:MAG: hypothetical protein Q4D87_06450 [Actinomycetaceae bacterium]|nr:hypothetical protein [Actinomycetaceae bacterium]